MNNAVLKHIDHCKYLVTLQLVSRFSNQIANKISNNRKRIGMIRTDLQGALEGARLFAYKSLCLPHPVHKILSQIGNRGEGCKDDLYFEGQYRCYRSQKKLQLETLNNPAQNFT